MLFNKKPLESPKGTLSFFAIERCNMSSDIFNTDKSDYHTPSLFLGEKKGLVDTVNGHFPEIQKIYKTMKSQDWDELDFDFTSCNVEFKTCSKDIYDAMILTLGWQWEADSTVAHNIAPMIAPLVSGRELWSAWLRITDNENVHACTYSEIFRCSFDDPEDVLKTVLENNNAIKRLSSVTDVLGEVYTVSHRYALGLETDLDYVYDHALMFTITLLYLERLQFMASFAVTFTITDTGLFAPIGNAVQKIAQDEVEVHTALDKEVIRIELATERGRASYARIKDKMNRVLNEVVEQECIWTDYLFSEGRQLLGLTPGLLKEWVAFNANDIYNFMGYDISPSALEALGLDALPTKNPLIFMEDIIDISKNQPSPQEEDVGAYKVNIRHNNDAGIVFDDDF